MSLTITNPALTSTTDILSTHSIGTFLPSNSNYISNNNSPQPQQKLTPMMMFHSQQQPPLVTSMSPEIFAKICEHLTPTDILKLSTVCKQYRNFLNSPSSTVSQNIWRTSRMKFLTYPKLSPPQGMDERSYIRITYFDKSCEICGNCDPGSSRIYWEFRVRCCDKCLLERTKTFEELEESEEIPVNVIEDAIPCVWIRGGAFTVPVHRYYWIDNVESISQEYSTLRGRDCTSWLSMKKEQHKTYMAEVSRYYLEDQKQWNDMQKKNRNR